MLKDKDGDKLTFWGGGVDTQQTLPYGTPEEVRKQVLERLDAKIATYEERCAVWEREHLRKP